MEKQTFNLSPEQITLCGRIVDLGLSQNETLKALTVTLFTAEVLASKPAYNAARNEMERYAVATRGMVPASARTFVYRLLQRAEIDAPGKNAGKANGNASVKSAEEALADAIVAVGFENAMKAIRQACAANDYSKARKVIDALQRAHKAEQDAAEPDAVAETADVTV